MKKRLVIGVGVLGMLAIGSGVLSFNSLLLFILAGVIPGTDISLPPGFIIAITLLGTALVLAHIIIQRLLPYVPKQPRSLPASKTSHKPITAQLVIPQRKIGHDIPPRRFHRI